jgi:propanediol dehydratase small subunit
VGHVYWLVFLFRDRNALERAVRDVRERFGTGPRYYVQGSGEVGAIYVVEDYALAAELYGYVRSAYYLELSDIAFMELYRAESPWGTKAWGA